MVLLRTSSDKAWKEREAKERLIAANSGLGSRWIFTTRQKLYKPRQYRSRLLWTFLILGIVEMLLVLAVGEQILDLQHFKFGS